MTYIASGTANINSDANGKVGSGRANIANANLRVSNYSGNLTSSTKFTMSGWMKLSAKGSWPRIFVGNPSNGDRSCWEIWRESDSQVKVNGGNSSTTATFNLGLGTGTWYYLTLVYDGTSVTLYSNGNSQGSGTVATPAHKTYLSIGGPGTTADRSIVGTFDEVRMYNGALSADRVAADYATMNDPTTFITLASAPQAAALTHRWSFNTDGYDYTDSITGAAPASKFGNDGSRKTQGGKLVLTGSGSGQGSLGLGKNLLGSGDATVEIWASHDAVKNYARVFDYGNGSYGRNPNQTDCFIFAWSTGTDAGRDIVLMKKANATVFERHGTMSAMEFGKQYYFAVTFKDNGDGSSTIKWMRRDAVTGALERYKEETVSGWTLATLAATNPDFWLGVSKYSTDHDANASYDEVRIWNGALGEDQLAANAAMGPNALTTGLSAGFNLAADAVFRVPSAGYTASGAVTLGAGAKLLFDTASFDGQSITFSATGFMVPSGGILDYVELTDSVNFTATLSGNAITVTRNASAPVTAQWAGASAPASAADLAVAANWTCRDASGNVVAGVVPGAATTIVIPDGTTSFTIPSDATPTWAGIRFGGHSGTKWGQNGSNGTGSSYTWRDTALKDYAFKGDGDLANLTGANTSWQTTNMKAKRVRFDGWVNIPDGASLFGGFSSITVGAGGLTLDTAGRNVSLANGGLLAAQGSSIVKAGEGTLSVASLPQVDTVSVAKGTLALSASCDNASMLAHRWSFTSDLTDSVTGTAGGATASAGVTYSDGKASLTGGNKGTCYINLGANKLPSDSVTLEFWTTITTRKVWTKMFCLGKDSGSCLAFTFNRNSDSGVSGLDVEPNGGTYTGTGTLDANTPYYLAFTLKPNASGGTEIKGYCYNATTGALVGSLTQTLANWSLIDKIIQQSFCLGYSFWNDPDAYADYDEVRVWSGALSADAIALSATKGPDATAADIAEIMAATSAASPALRTLTLESGATLSLGAGNTLTQPVVKGGGTVSGGTLKVANELLVTDLDDCLIVDGGTLDIDGAKVVFSAAALQALAATGRTYTLVSAVNGGTITGSPLQPTDLPPGWRVKTTSSSVILRKDGMSIHIR